MNTASSALLWMALQVFLFTLIGGAVFLLLRRRGPGAAGMCATVVLGLSLPILFVLVSPWPRWNDGLNISDARTQTASKNVAQIAVVDDSHSTADKTTSDATGAITTLKTLWNAAVQSLSPDAASMAAASSGSRNWTQWLPWLLAAGTCLGLVRLAAGVWSVRYPRRGSTPIEDTKLYGEIDRLGRLMQHPHPALSQRERVLSGERIEVRESSALRSAATIGWRRPVVLLPADWHSWTETERRVVLAHELAHIVRGDFLTGVVARLAAVVHFYQPLVLWLGRQLRVQQELAADGAAAAATGSQQVYLTTLAQMALRADEQSIPWGARAFLPGTSMLIKRVAWLKRGQGRKVEKSLSRSAWWLMIAVLTSVALGVAGIRGPNSSLSNLAMAAAPEENSAKPQAEMKAGNAQPQAEVKQNESQTQTKSLRTLEFVPANAKLVMAISPSELIKLASGVKPLTAMVDQEMQTKNGFKFSELADMEMIWVDSTKNPDRIVLRSVKPVDWKGTLKRKGSDAQLKQFAGHEYFVENGGDFGPCIYIADDRTIVAGSEEQIQRILGGQDTPMDAAQLIDFETAPLTIRAGMAGVKSITGLDKLQKNLESNPVAAMFLPLLEHIQVIRSAALTGEKDQVGLVVKLTCDKTDGAREVAKNLEAARTVGLNLLNAKKSAWDAETAAHATQEQTDMMNQFFNGVVKTLTEAKIQPDGSITTVTANADLGQAVVAGFVMPAMAASREAAMRRQSMNNMKMLGLGMYQYEDINKQFAPPAICTKEGKPVLSWRVAILPFIDQYALYNEFHLDEPWDSEHNKPLIAKMPVVFRDPHESTQSTNSSYFMPTGKGMFGGIKEGIKMRNIKDGPSQTIMLVEAKRDIPWTKPEDIEIDADASKPIPAFGGNLTTDNFLATFADGHVEVLSKSINPKLLHAMLTIDGGEIIPDNDIKASSKTEPMGVPGAISVAEKAYAASQHKIEFRLAESEPGEGLTEVESPKSREKIYLHSQIELNQDDIANAYVRGSVQPENPEKIEPVVFVTLTDEGAKKIRALSQANRSKTLAIMVDGKVVSAFKIAVEITKDFGIDGGHWTNWTEKEAEQIAEALRGS